MSMTASRSRQKPRAIKKTFLTNAIDGVLIAKSLEPLTKVTTSDLQIPWIVIISYPTLWLKRLHLSWDLSRLSILMRPPHTLGRLSLIKLFSSASCFLLPTLTSWSRISQNWCHIEVSFSSRIKTSGFNNKGNLRRDWESFLVNPRLPSCIYIPSQRMFRDWALMCLSSRR